MGKAQRFHGQIELRGNACHLASVVLVDRASRYAGSRRDEKRVRLDSSCAQLVTSYLKFFPTIDIIFNVNE